MSLVLSCFNPRARVGRDIASVTYRLTALRFNPRARVGRDNFARPCITAAFCVSIHAPAWGATTYRNLRIGFHTGFNPRARVGRDLNESKGRKLYAAFQSTRPRGARLTLEYSVE